MRVLMLTTPVPTHLTPLVPLAWALRAAGHELLVAGQPDVLEAARCAGLNAVSIGTRFDLGAMLLAGLPDGVRPIELRGRPAPEVMGEYGRVWMVHAERMLPDYLHFARGFRPDLILADPLEYVALIVGGVLGVPVVQHRWGVDPISTPARPKARLALAEACRSVGLAGLPDPHVLLDPCPPSLQLPGVEPATPLRCVPYNGGGAVPAWLGSELGEGRPGPRRVAVSVGGLTLVMHGVPFLRRLLWAFDGLPDVEAVATVDAVHREEIGPVPGNVRMIDPTPLNMFLGRCAAVVHHGGAGTSMSATDAGLPQLVLPQISDQFAAGDRLAARGAAIAIDDAARQNDPAALRAALAALLEDDSYAKAARELGREMRDQPTPARIAADLERLARNRPNKEEL
ncbi:nucleotide disphospho-sugar-binding domain-containing protein [Plantactinospora sp. B6F1]|uniref:nucleotide disphospho-sugar-binding domain-containing protein n=1 Tax=Plantactinospora sp. B6F1 TaxID=3158971 RepID=UPI00102C6597